MLQPEQDEQLELDDGEVPLQQQHVRADGGGEAELDGQEQRDPGVEERGLADGSDGAARRALSWRAGRTEVRHATAATTTTTSTTTTTTTTTTTISTTTSTTTYYLSLIHI